MAHPTAYVSMTLDRQAYERAKKDPEVVRLQRVVDHLEAQLAETELAAGNALLDALARERAKS